MVLGAKGWCMVRKWKMVFTDFLHLQPSYDKGLLVRSVSSRPSYFAWVRHLRCQKHGTPRKTRPG